MIEVVLLPLPVEHRFSLAHHWHLNMWSIDGEYIGLDFAPR